MKNEEKSKKKNNNLKVKISCVRLNNSSSTINVVQFTDQILGHTGEV